MLMRGDLEVITKDVNRVLEGAFARIQALEDKVQALENPKTEPAVAPSRRTKKAA